MGALQSLSGANASPFQPITEKLLKTSEEIIADPSYLSQVSLWNCCLLPEAALCCHMAPGVTCVASVLQALGALHDDSKSLRVKTQQVKLQVAMQQLLQSMQAPCCPSYSATVLLRALSHVNGQVRAGTWLQVGTSSNSLLLHLDLFLSGHPVCPASCPGSPPGAERP